MVAPLTTSATRRLKYNLCDRVGGGRKSSFQQNTLMTRVVPAAAAMKMEWDKDVEYPPETASRWLSYVRESLTTIYFTPNMLDWYKKETLIMQRLQQLKYFTSTVYEYVHHLCHHWLRYISLLPFLHESSIQSKSDYSSCHLYFDAG